MCLHADIPTENFGKDEELARFKKAVGFAEV
jgi:hypothetical protein